MALSCYAFDKRLIVRTPTLPLPGNIKEMDYDSLLKDDFFLEALYLASPILHEECIKWRDGLMTNKKDVDKLKRTLTKYYLRMSSRCTPFGLFSGCAVAQWDGEGAIRLDSKKMGRHIRLDMHYLCALAKQLPEWPSIKSKLFFSRNSSMYLIGEELRYVEYVFVEGTRNYRISSVAASDYLMKVLQFAADGATIGRIADCLMMDNRTISEEEAEAFIQELISSQLLVSELEPCITGKEFMDQIIDVLERIAGEDADIRFALDTLLAVRSQLRVMNEGRENNIPQYRQIMKLLDGLGVVYNEGKLFQTDLTRSLCENGVKSTVQQQIGDALGVFNKLTAAKVSDSLASFTKRFYERYGDKEMPLLEVMDTEMGIGYQDIACTCMSPLLGDLQITGARGEQRIAWSRLEVFLNDKLGEALQNNRAFIELNDNELEKFSSDQTLLPSSLSVMFRLLDDDTVYLENAGGSSAVNLLGRFAHADEGIHQLASDIAAKEQSQAPDIIYAEIVHLPESRTGNILLHPAFRNYEIPYLAKSSLDKEFNIDVQDLFVSVRKGKVILRSKRLKKRVIPRLSNAHNYSSNSLPVYRFLCDLQIQETKGAIGFSWGSLQFQNKFLPRVVYKNTVLQLARWSFTAQDLDVLKTAAADMAKNPAGDTLNSKLDSWRKKWRIPRHIVLSEGDNELLIDLESEQMVQIFIDCVKNKENFTVKEFPMPGQRVTDENGAPYANQFIAILHKNEPCYAEPEAGLPFEHPEADEKRAFNLGSEWVYFKLYCGIRSADRILLEAIHPMTNELSAKALIDKWFFIRYNDPEFHLRIRFHLRDVRNIGEIIMIIHSHLKSFEADGYIWKLQTDTYNREIERYGKHAIGLAETLFYHDSIACLKMLDNTRGDERETIRWVWGLRAVDQLLESFGLTIHERHALLHNLRGAYGNEFNVDKNVRTQLNDKYRDNKKIIEIVMKGREELPAEWRSLVEALDERSRELVPIVDRISDLYAAGKMELSLFSLLGSYIHMMLNRIVTSEPRVHELVIYDFLARHYKTMVVRSEQEENSLTETIEKKELVQRNA